jgi:hypothetical protein
LEKIEKWKTLLTSNSKLIRRLKFMKDKLASLKKWLRKKENRLGFGKRSTRRNYRKLKSFRIRIKKIK